MLTHFKESEQKEARGRKKIYTTHTYKPRDAHSPAEDAFHPKCFVVKFEEERIKTELNLPEFIVAVFLCHRFRTTFFFVCVCVLLLPFLLLRCRPELRGFFLFCFGLPTVCIHTNR